MKVFTRSEPDSEAPHGATRLLLALALSASLSARADTPTDGGSWPTYGGAPGGGQYSPLRQIDAGNVGKLKLLWTFRTGELGASLPNARKLTFEANPIVAEGRMYI